MAATVAEAGVGILTGQKSIVVASSGHDRLNGETWAVRTRVLFEHMIEVRIRLKGEYAARLTGRQGQRNVSN